jgi:predicted aldo/keto reductase-like oxidoreductase
MVELKLELNSEKIMREISYMIDSGVSYIDAIVEYSEQNGLEIEVLGEIIRRSPILKAKIYEEAEGLNLVEKIVRLPI